MVDGMRFRVFAIAALSVCFWVMSCVVSPAAQALTPINLTDVSYRECPPELAEGMVVAGSISDANCFLIEGKAHNDSGKPVYNVDVFGRVYDANMNPVMQNRTRLGSIGDVEPGTRDFQIRISVAANQPTPLKLEQFKASGFAGRVRR